MVVELHRCHLYLIHGVLEQFFDIAVNFRDFIIFLIVLIICLLIIYLLDFVIITGDSVVPCIMRHHSLIRCVILGAKAHFRDLLCLLIEVNRLGRHRISVKRLKLVLINLAAQI